MSLGKRDVSVYKTPRYGHTETGVICLSKASFYCIADNAGGKHDSAEIKRALGAVSGVTSVSVSRGGGKIAVDYDTTGVRSEQILEKLKNLGYEVVDSKFENHIM